MVTDVLFSLYVMNMTSYLFIHTTISVQEDLTYTNVFRVGTGIILMTDCHLYYQCGVMRLARISARMNC